VRRNVVVAREDKPGDKRLVAYYVVSERGQEPTPSEFRAFMKAKVPEYMVPSAFVGLEAFPLTPNGKVDRRSLPAPGLSDIRAENVYAEPRTPAAEQLVEIWEEVLGLERVGIHDDFFELGGHSLLAVRVVTRLNRHFGVDLPLRVLFEDPTIEGLALAVTQMQAEAEIDIEQMLAQVEQLQDHSIPQASSDAPGTRPGAHGRGHPGAPSLFRERSVEGFPALLRPAVAVVQRTGVPGSS
jgi:acyl carrier protein